MDFAEKISERVLSREVEGVNLLPGTFRDQLGEQATLLVFLRHFGCLFCREVVGDLRRLSSPSPEFPKVLFFFLGEVEDGERFFRKYWPAATAIADSEKFFYEAFSIERGSVSELFGSGVFTAGLRAAIKGHRMGMPIGDPLMMPGYFIVRGAEITWAHRSQQIWDHPDFDRIPQWARKSL